MCKCEVRISLPSVKKQMCIDCGKYHDAKEPVVIKHQR